jgi:hypothetical protein
VPKSCLYTTLLSCVPPQEQRYWSVPNVAHRPNGCPVLSLNYVGYSRPSAYNKLNNLTPWLWSASELYRPSDRRIPAKLMPNFVDRGCRVVRATYPLGRWSRFSRPRAANFSIQVAPQLSSWSWVNPVPDPLLLRISGSVGNRTWNLWICSQELWPLDHRGGLRNLIQNLKFNYQKKKKKFEQLHLPGCSNECYGRSLQTFRKNELPPFSGANSRSLKQRSKQTLRFWRRVRKFFLEASKFT